VPDLRIEGLKQDVIERLAHKADAAGLGLEAYVTRVLSEDAEQLTIEEFAERARALAAADPSATAALDDVVHTIRAARGPFP
jgi:hypothetical protein